VDASKLLDKAQTAAERGNYDYAVALYLQLLEFQPDHEDARKLLRSVEVRKCQERGVTSATASGWVKGIGSLLAAYLYMVLRKYEKAMAACEAFLRNDPYNGTVLRLLARAAERGDMLKTAILVYEDVRSRSGTPTKGMALKQYVKVLRQLAELYIQTEQLPLANERLEEILRLVPKDREAERRVRDVAAQRSMVEGGWDKAGRVGGYREVLKSKEKAEDLEDAHRDIRTQHDVELAIDRVKKDLADDPQNTRYLIQLGDLYKMLSDWQQSRATYGQALELDPSNFLVKERLGDLKLAEMDEQIGALGKDESQKARLEELRQQRMAYALEEYERRVKARPQDLPTRFHLGEILLRMKRYKDASVQFQHSARDPKTRRPSLYRLGLCFMQQGLVDLAIEQFQKAIAGASLVDQEVKSILYALARAQERQNRLSEALEAYKRVFEVDINFKDVSSKIEELYKQGAKDVVGEAEGTSAPGG